MLQKIDFIATKYSLKPLMRGHAASQEEFRKIELFCQGHGLFAVRNKIKIRNPALGEKGEYCVYISKDKRIAQKCANEDPEYGYSPSLSKLKYFSKALGYPECCIDSYINLSLSNLSEKRKKEILFQKIIQKRKPFFLNNFLYGPGLSLSFYEPCSYHCKKALEYNKKIFEAVRKEDPYFAAKIRIYLQFPILIWLDSSLDSKVNSFFHNRIQLFFEGHIDNSKAIYYNKANLYRKYPHCNRSFEEGQLREIFLGNICKVYNNKIIIFYNNTILKEIKANNKYHALIVKFN